MTDSTHQLPWYRRTVRWGQTNLNELDPTRYDAEWWRAYWRRTRVQGLVVNAGGIVAYYPSETVSWNPDRTWQDRVICWLCCPVWNGRHKETSQYEGSV
jgi:hypothetical protein